ncbi:hypothetical protein Sjap_013491 [Stephania japonica]|uniref:Uncharacterized protein n=1 Tax=Stephania japonica TaxID=461633 RepID=A0AAP0IXZ9_9MAGN
MGSQGTNTVVVGVKVGTHRHGGGWGGRWEERRWCIQGRSLHQTKQKNEKRRERKWGDLRLSGLTEHAKGRQSPNLISLVTPLLGFSGRELDQLMVLSCSESFHEKSSSCLLWWLLVRASKGKGVVAVRALVGKGAVVHVLEEDPDQLQGSTTRWHGGRHGRRPQTTSYRKSKELTRVIDASDVDEVQDETSAVNASATVGREIKLHKSQVTTFETSSSDSIEEDQDESQEQKADREYEGDEGENEDQEEVDEEGEEEGEEE